jgi:hypothetical protein
MRSATVLVRTVVLRVLCPVVATSVWCVACGDTTSDHHGNTTGTGGAPGSGAAAGGIGGATAAGTGGTLSLATGGSTGVSGGAAGATGGAVGAAGQPETAGSGGAAGAGGAGPICENPGPYYDAVYPTDAVEFGKTLVQWLESEWAWFSSMPATGNPLNGGACEQNQAGPVWFLTPGRNGMVENRTCTIPANTALVVTPGSRSPHDTPESVCPPLDDTAARNQFITDLAPATFAEVCVHVYVDGVLVQITSDNLVTSTAVYRFVGDALDPLFPNIGPIPANTCGLPVGGDRRAVVRGFAVILEPLSAGSHTVRITRSGNPVPGGAAIDTDVTYTLTVQ